MLSILAELSRESVKPHSFSARTVLVQTSSMSLDPDSDKGWASDVSYKKRRSLHAALTRQKKKWRALPRHSQ